MTDLLEPELDSFSRPDRVRAWLRLSEGGGISSVYDSIAYLDRALADVRGRARAAGSRAGEEGAPARLPTSRQSARRRRGRSRRCRPRARRGPSSSGPRSTASAGRAPCAGCRSTTSASASAPAPTRQLISPTLRSPSRACGSSGAGEIEPARTILTNFLAESDVRGEEVSYALQRLNLCDLELRAGNWDAAERLLDEWESADRQLLIEETYLRSRALLAVGRGFPAEAEPLAARSLAGAEPRGYYWQVNEARRALGVGALLAHEPAARGGEPRRGLGAHAAGGSRRAWCVPGRARPGRGARRARPAGRGEGGDGAATRPGRGAGASVGARGGEAVRRAGAPRRRVRRRGAPPISRRRPDAYGELGLRFDRARTLLSLGRAQRRVRKWGAARSVAPGSRGGVRRDGIAGMGRRGPVGAGATRRPAPPGVPAS